LATADDGKVLLGRQERLRDQVKDDRKNGKSPDAELILAGNKHLLVSPDRAP
jgi:hypothetical protein